MAKANKPPMKQFSVNFPISIIEEIDTICSATYVSRTSWLIKAAQDKLNSIRAENERKLKEKLKEETD